MHPQHYRVAVWDGHKFYHEGHDMHRYHVLQLLVDLYFELQRYRHMWGQDPANKAEGFIEDVLRNMTSLQEAIGHAQQESGSTSDIRPTSKGLGGKGKGKGKRGAPLWTFPDVPNNGSRKKPNPRQRLPPPTAVNLQLRSFAVGAGASNLSGKDKSASSTDFPDGSPPNVHPAQTDLTRTPAPAQITARASSSRPLQPVAFDLTIDPIQWVPSSPPAHSRDENATFFNTALIPKWKRETLQREYTAVGELDENTPRHQPPPNHPPVVGYTIGPSSSRLRQGSGGQLGVSAHTTRRPLRREYAFVEETDVRAEGPQSSLPIAGGDNGRYNLRKKRHGPATGGEGKEAGKERVLNPADIVGHGEPPTRREKRRREEDDNGVRKPDPPKRAKKE